MQPTPDIQLFLQQLYARYPKTLVTPLIVAINVLMFIYMLTQGAGIMGSNIEVYIENGANFGPLTRQGEWWRLLVSTTLHYGILHLAFNMWALWEAGNLTERLYGHAGFLAIYLYAGLFGSLGSLYWHPQGVVSAGASGAVFGVFGALLAYLLTQRQSMPVVLLKRLRHSALFFTGFSLFYGFSVPGIDNAAHIGGLFGGLLIGLVLSQPVSLTKPKLYKSAIVHALFLVVIASAISHTAPPAFDYHAQKNAEQSIRDFVNEDHRLIDEWKSAIDEIKGKQNADLLTIMQELDKQLEGWTAMQQRIDQQGDIRDETRHTTKQLNQYADLRKENILRLTAYLKTGDSYLLDLIRENNRKIKTILDELNSKAP